MVVVLGAGSSAATDDAPARTAASVRAIADRRIEPRV
jgi:hypothetical protein